jgi:hypothetical protein
VLHEHSQLGNVDDKNDSRHGDDEDVDDGVDDDDAIRVSVPSYQSRSADQPFSRSARWSEIQPISRSAVLPIG